jgi:hypothetical protein
VVGRFDAGGRSLQKATPKKRRGKGEPVEAVENQTQVSHGSHRPLEISPTPRDSPVNSALFGGPMKK